MTVTDELAPKKSLLPLSLDTVADTSEIQRQNERVTSRNRREKSRRDMAVECVPVRSEITLTCLYPIKVTGSRVIRYTYQIIFVLLICYILILYFQIFPLSSQMTLHVIPFINFGPADWRRQASFDLNFCYLDT